MDEARFYDRRPDGKVECHLCPHECVIAPGKVGICKARQNIEGVLYSLIYGEFTSMHLDPIEKKPLYHFHPGEFILSIGTWGCNFRCSFCQNWEISQQEAGTHNVILHELTDLAQARGSVGIAYTYNEPSIWYEFVYDCAQEARKAGLVNVLVTNGYIQEQPLRELLPAVNAMNIDLKSFRDEFYRSLCGGRIEPVKRTIKIAAAATHVELTMLIIPGHNDSVQEWDEAARWVAGEVSPDTPMHLSAFVPRYELKAAPTPVSTLEKAGAAFSKHLRYVYLGNVTTADGSDTRCPSCGATLIHRAGYQTEIVGLAGTRCAKCSAQIPIVRQLGET